MYSGGILRRFSTLGLACFCALAAAVRAEHTCWYVDDDGAGDPRPADPTVSDPLEDGTPEHPFDAIQEAIDAASEGDEIILADGRYSGVGNLDISFLGKAITVRSANGPESCVVDCAEAGRGFSFHALETRDSVLEGVTLRRCAATADDAQGGGIRCINSSPTIRNCVVTESFAQGFFSAGGGVYCLSADPAFLGCRIQGNRSSGLFSNGGAIYLDFSDAVLADCVISDNRAGFAGGGVVCERNSRPTFLRTTISDNMAQFGGGMIIQSASQPLLHACVIRGNMADSTAGIQVDSSDPVIRDSLIVGNVSFKATRGGLDTGSNSNTIVTNCTIAGNSTGMSCNDPASEVQISNSIFFGNGMDLIDCVPSYSLIGVGDHKIGEGNITGDPLFDSEDDYHLQAASPCVNQGDSMFEPDIGYGDFDGHWRVLCGRVDMGAFELGIGDFDCNQDLTLQDYSRWPACMAGPQGHSLKAGCQAFDFDADGDVDLADYAGFANELPG